MKIAVIGTGNIGQAVGALWCKAGHEVTFSARNLARLRSFAADLGPAAAVASPEEAAATCEAALLAVPLHAIPALGPACAPSLRRKLLLDACNPYPDRDGNLALEAVADGKGSGQWTATQFPGADVVKAFNTIYFKDLSTEAHRAGAPLAVPLAGDNKAALEIAARLVRDAGFEPLLVGALGRSREFDVGKGPYGKSLTASELRAYFGTGS